MTTLFKTIVGSHVWKMNTCASDIDIARVRVEPTINILKNTADLKTTFEAGIEDTTIYEIGSLIENLIKCNINTITVVSSQLQSVYEKGSYRKDLNDIVVANLSKDIFNSTHGLGLGNYNKYIIGRNEIYNQKRIDNICRVLQFGITVLETGLIEFKPYYGTVEEIPILLREIQVARLNSTLPEKSDPEPFREFLYNIRIKELNGEL